VIPIYDFGWQLIIPRLCTVIIGIMTYLYEKDNNYKVIFSLYGYTALLSFMSFVKGSYLSTPAMALLISMNKNYLPFRPIVSFLGRHSFEIYLGQALCLNWLYFFDLNYNEFIAFSFLGLSCSAFLLWASHYLFWKIAVGNH
jgi:peptidoglycan/LPS O-acetylase OafA/YrhL